MRFDEAADQFLTDWASYGRLNSKHTLAAYRIALTALSEEVGNRDPRTVGRNDIKRTLARWSHPNTQAARRAALNSFFKWAMQEDLRKDNPVDQTTPPKKRDPKVYRLTLDEIQILVDACQTTRESRAIHLGLFAGFRNAEMCGLTGRDFEREGSIRVVGKGDRERWVPVLTDLLPTCQEIRHNVQVDEYVFPGRGRAGQPVTTHGMRKIVERVVKRAGLSERITPHTLRHGFGDHIARYAGMRNAQFLLGHKSVGTTQIYMDKPTLDELRASVAGASFLLPPAESAVQPMGDLERSLIGGIESANSRKAFGRVLTRLRADLSPIVEDMRNV